MKSPLLLLPLSMLAGCATTNLDIDKAYLLCQNNGGVSEIQIKYNRTIRVKCTDTARFTFKGVKDEDQIK